MTGEIDNSEYPQPPKEDQTLDEIIEACNDPVKLRKALNDCRSQRNTWCDEAFRDKETNEIKENEGSKVDDDQALKLVIEVGI